MSDTIARTYDAIVIGSGITGGWAAKELTEKGLRVLMIERGRNVVHRQDYITEHKNRWDMPLRNARLTADKQGTEDYQIQARTGQFSESTKHFFVNDREQPYEEVKPFTWIQGNQVGGKSLLWGRQVYRWSDLDFEANLKDGHGVDWPIRYKDIAPWYSYVERHIGVSGERLGLSHLPDGEFMPPMEMNAGEKHLKRSVERAIPGRHVTMGRVAILTRDHKGRAACHYCGPCERGCSTGSYFSTQSSTLPYAQATGRLTVLADTIVHSLVYDEAKQRVSMVRVVDTRTNKMQEIGARVVFVCASAIGSTRVLLNSTSSRFPNGIANGSGALGHYLMDHHFQAGASGRLEGYDDRYYQGNRPNGIYVPRFRNLGDAASARSEYVRGFGYQGGAGREGWWRGTEEQGIGVSLKRRLHNAGQWNVGLGGFAETLPRYESSVTLSDRTDDYGIPIPRIDCGWGPNERAMRPDMMQAAAEMLEKAGCKDIEMFNNDKTDGLGAEPGLAIHEMGTARMGRDPKSSVLNGWNQAHEVPNLFVTDGACMTSASCVNPSITYMALTARACDYAVRQMKARSL